MMKRIRLRIRTMEVRGIMKSRGSRRIRMRIKNSKIWSINMKKTKINIVLELFLKNLFTIRRILG